MVNLFNVTLEKSLLSKPVLITVPMKIPILAPNFYTNKIPMNIFTDNILRYIASHAKMSILNPVDMPTRNMEFSRGYAGTSMAIPACENINFAPLEKYMGTFFVLHTMSSIESDAEYLCQVSVYFDIKDGKVYLYAPEINMKLDFGKFSTY